MTLLDLLRPAVAPAAAVASVLLLGPIYGAVLIVCILVLIYLVPLAADKYRTLSV
jgi:hypothetical protein